MKILKRIFVVDKGDCNSAASGLPRYAYEGDTNV